MPIRISPACARAAAPGRRAAARPVERTPPRKPLRFTRIPPASIVGSPRSASAARIFGTSSSGRVSPGPLDPAGHHRAGSPHPGGARAVGAATSSKGSRPTTVSTTSAACTAPSRTTRVRTVRPARDSRQPQQLAHVDDRHHGAPEVRHAHQVAGSPRNRGDLIEEHDLAGAAHIHCEPRPGQLEQAGPRRRRGIRSRRQHGNHGSRGHQRYFTNWRTMPRSWSAVNGLAR